MTGNLGIGGTPSSPNITLNANGNITAGTYNTLTVGLGGGSQNANTAVGRNALSNNTTGNYSTALGLSALFTNTGGGSNTAVGQGALHNNITGNYNTAVGREAGYYIEGSNNTILGAYRGSTADATLSDTVIISAGKTERLRINSSGSALIGGTPSSPNITLNADGSATFTGNITAANVSDIRFKENIADAQPQLADVITLGSSLKNWDWKEEAPLNDELKAKRFLGLIAQEAELVCPDLTYEVSKTKNGKELTPAELDEDGNVVVEATYEQLDDTYKAINHDILVMKLLGAVAEQNATIEDLKARLDAAGA